MSSDPRVIADAIEREKIRYLMVADPMEYEYFLPTEDERWWLIERAYPGLFQLVHRGPGYRVFELAK